MSAAAQNMPGGSAAGGPITGSDITNQNLKPGLNNTNYLGGTNGPSLGAVTNKFGHGDMTNRFGSRLLTNGFGDGAITNRFKADTNPAMINRYINTNDSNYGYTNRNRLKNPYLTDPRVMGNNGLNNTN